MVGNKRLDTILVKFILKQDLDIATADEFAKTNKIKAGTKIKQYSDTQIKHEQS